MTNKEGIRWGVYMTLSKYRAGEDTPYEVLQREGNLLLTAGATELWNLLTGAGTAYSNANARIGVGNGTAAASAGQTGLQGGSTAYQGQESGYPSISGADISFRSIFGDGVAEFDWEEWVVDNGPTTLNRKVTSLGTKNAGESWQMDVTISIS